MKRMSAGVGISRSRPAGRMAQGPKRGRPFQSRFKTNRS